MMENGDIVIFTVREVTGMEYVVSLDEYDDEIAYINIVDLGNKLKVGSKNFGEVNTIYGPIVYLSLLDDDRRLYREDWSNYTS